MKKKCCETCGLIEFNFEEIPAIQEDDLKNAIIISPDDTIAQRQLVSGKYICARCGGFISNPRSNNLIRCKKCQYYKSIRDCVCPKCGRINWIASIMVFMISAFLIFGVICILILGESEGKILGIEMSGGPRWVSIILLVTAYYPCRQLWRDFKILSDIKKHKR